MVPFSRLLDALSEVPDPRRAEGKRYPLAPLLLFTVLALLSGATSYRRIISFLEQRRIVLNALFGCSLKRAPSLNALRAILQTLDRDTLEEAFRRHAQGLLPAPHQSRTLRPLQQLRDQHHARQRRRKHRPQTLYQRTQLR